MSSTAIKTNRRIETADKGSLAFKLLILGLAFSVLRPDMFLFGDTPLKYFSTVLIGIVLVMFFQSEEKNVWNTQTKLMVLLSLLMVIQVPFARNPALSFHHFSRFAMLTLALFVVRLQFLDRPARISTYAKTYVVCNIFVAVLGMLGKGKVNVPILNDENDFCLLMNILISMAFFLGKAAKSKPERMLFYGSVVIFLVGSLTSLSRGGFIGLFFVGFFLLLKSEKKILTIILLLLVILASSVFAPENYRQEMETIFTEGTESGTGRERIESWKAAYRMFLDHPLIGVGPYNYGLWLPQYYGGGNPDSMWGRVAHSLFFTVLSELGAIGTFIFGYMIVRNYKDYFYAQKIARQVQKLVSDEGLNAEERKVLKAEIGMLRHMSNGIWCAMVAFLSTGVFISVLWYNYFWFLISLNSAIAIAGKRTIARLIEIQEKLKEQNTRKR